MFLIDVIMARVNTAEHLQSFPVYEDMLLSQTTFLLRVCSVRHCDNISTKSGMSSLQSESLKEFTRRQSQALPPSLPTYPGKESEECIHHQGWRLHPLAPPHPVHVKNFYQPLATYKLWLLLQENTEAKERKIKLHCHFKGFWSKNFPEHWQRHFEFAQNTEMGFLTSTLIITKLCASSAISLDSANFGLSADIVGEGDTYEKIVSCNPKFEGSYDKTFQLGSR